MVSFTFAWCECRFSKIVQRNKFMNPLITREVGATGLIRLIEEFAVIIFKHYTGEKSVPENFFMSLETCSL